MYYVIAIHAFLKKYLNIKKPDIDAINEYILAAGFISIQDKMYVS